MNVEGCTDSCPIGCHCTIRFVKCVLYESSVMRILHCLLYTLVFSILLYAKSAVHKYLDKDGLLLSFQVSAGGGPFHTRGKCPWDNQSHHNTSELSCLEMRPKMLNTLGFCSLLYQLSFHLQPGRCKTQNLVSAVAKALSHQPPKPESSVPIFGEIL